jgi:hypothetical protein
MKKILLAKAQYVGQWEEMWARAFQKLNYDVTFVDLTANYDNIMVKTLGAFAHYMSANSLGHKARNFYKRISNANLVKALTSSEYDIFFIYNGWNQITSDTWQIIGERTDRKIALLGDNPFLTVNDNDNVLLNYLTHMDLFLTVDLYALQCLRYFKANSLLIPAGTDDDMFFPLIPSKTQMQEYSSDLLFVGNGYGMNTLGIFRANMLNELGEFDIKIFGNKNWEKLFPYFPHLRSKLIFKPLTSQELNIAYNCSKIFIGLTNPIAVDAVHTRVFDSIASGLFVIYEHRDDCHRLFPDDLVPTFRNIKELKDKVQYYLKNEKEREEKATEARKLVLEKYLVRNIVKEIV